MEIIDRLYCGFKALGQVLALFGRGEPGIMVKGLTISLAVAKIHPGYTDFNEVEAKVKKKKSCLKSTVLTEKYGKFQGFSLTSTLTLTWQFSK